jgi:hypothetical protein
MFDNKIYSQEVIERYLNIRKERVRQMTQASSDTAFGKTTKNPILDDVGGGWCNNGDDLREVD